MTAYRAIVMGSSAGGYKALALILPALPAHFPLPVLIVQHLHPSDDGDFARHLAELGQLKVIVPCDKQIINPGCVYFAPANYHMLVERNETITLSVEEKVNWSRPSIDVLFESAALVWEEALVAVILSGANADGAKGLCAVKAAGGLTVVQDPSSAKMAIMPQAAIDTGAVDKVLHVEDIGRFLDELGVREKAV